MPDTMERIGPYRLVRRLGEGGMGVVHLGVEPGGGEVAVKVLHPHVAADLKARDRLTREVETMRRVRSPRVAEVLDAELDGPTPYIVTRFAPGRTLEQTVLEDGPLPPHQVVRLARGLCEALVAIHAANVIHRDFKPANVMLVDGDPLVIDFGIAHLVNATRLTQTGMFIGTPGYLAPEIIRDGEITLAADVHALAATVFFGATGQPPFGTGTFESVCYNILEGRAQLDLAPPWLRKWLASAFNVDAALRPTAQTLLRMAYALDPDAPPPPEPPQLDRGTRVLDPGTRVLDPGTRVLDDGPPPGPPSSNGARAPDDYSDLLPPVRYAPPPPGPPPPYPAAPPPYPDQRVAGYPPPPPTGPPRPNVPPPPAAQPYAPEEDRRDRPGYRTRHPVIAALLLTIVVALACVLPVLVSAFALVAVVCLRVANHLLGDLDDRRSVRGGGSGDALIALIGTPWALVKSALATLVALPVAAMFAMIVWGVAAYAGGMTTDIAAAYAAGGFTAGLFLLPGGGAPRKAVRRALTGVIRSPGAAMVTTITLGTIAFFTVMICLNNVPSWVPWRPPSEVIDDLIRRGQDSIVGLLGGVVGDLMDTLGMGFLNFWA